MKYAFLNSDSELARKLAECNDPAQIREVTQRHFEEKGIVAREEQTNGLVLTGKSMPAPEPPSRPQAPAAAQNHIRVIYPSGNARFELYGTSEEDLDRQEQQIRKMYGNQ